MNNEITIIEPFNYNTLDTETRILVQQATREIGDEINTIRHSAIKIGQRLIHVKGLLRHGEWGKWLEAEFGWSDQTAANYMNQAQLANQNPKFLELEQRISRTAMTKLAARTTPENARQEALQRAENGERITPTIAQEIINTAKSENKSEKTTNTPITQQILVIGKRTSWYKPAEINLWNTIYHTSRSVRAHNNNRERLFMQEHVFCINDDEWNNIYIAWMNYAEKLIVLREKLKNIGSYKQHLVENGEKARNPLTPTVISTQEIEEIEEKHEIPLPWDMPHLKRHTITRHTNFMLWYKIAGQQWEFSSGQRGYFICPDDTTWETTLQRWTEANQARENLVKIIESLDNYRTALQNKRYSYIPASISTTKLPIPGPEPALEPVLEPKTKPSPTQIANTIKQGREFIEKHRSLINQMQTITHNQHRNALMWMEILCTTLETFSDASTSDLST